MVKKIEHIAEELIMKYVEGGMSSSDTEKFERVLSQNEYLQKRVRALQSVVDLSPLETPPEDVHDAILSDLNLKDETKRTFLEEMMDEFFKFFDKKPIVLGATLVLFIAMLITITANQSEGYYNERNQSIADESIDLEDKGSDKEDLPDNHY